MLRTANIQSLQRMYINYLRGHCVYTFDNIEPERGLCESQPREHL